MPESADKQSHPMIREGRFWLVQLIVWSAFAALEISGAIESRQADGIEIVLNDIALKAMIPTSLGFTITSIFRFILLRVQHFDEKRFVAVAVGICLVGSVVYAIGHYEMKYLLGFHATSQLSEWRNWLSHAPSRLVILGGWTSVYVALTFISETVRNRSRMGELETAAAKARSEMLRYQVNPHLLFNALNTVSGHVLNKDTASADEAIQSLSDLLRFSLSDDEATSISLDQEIHRLRLYLAVEQTRFGETLKTDFSIPDELRAVELPPFLLQPLVENAMKHGISKSTEGGLIEVRAEKAGEDIHIIVRDEISKGSLDMETKPAPVSLGVGLKNVTERLAMFYGDAARLDIIEDTDQSFAVRVVLPAGMSA